MDRKRGVATCCECGREFDRSDPGADRKQTLATGEWHDVCPACMDVVRAAVGVLTPEAEEDSR